ncbi:MAG: 2Fe-2S iron-sulfur cluster-binding protein, partial [Streptosporangiaceae bacterium]
METEEFFLVVNGAEHTVRCEPDTPLLDVLRHDVGLAGPGFGCGLGLCGACMVLVDGQARSSCDLPVSAADGPVTTVEGLSSDGLLHPVQQAFLDEQAAQCGYCTAGMIMAAVDLLRKNPAPDEQEVRAALEGNLCRCGSHGRIVRAVLRAAGQVSGTAAPPSGPRPANDASPGPAPAETGGAPAGGASTGVTPAGVTPAGGASTGVTPAGGAPAGGATAASAGALPASLAANPVLGRWLDFGVGGEVTVRVGKVEYGQGIWTALAQVAAEELELGLTRVRMAPVSTSMSPDEGFTAGSRSVQDSGSALRQACAQARALLLAAASTRLAVSPAALTVTDGQILASGRPTGLSYWSLATAGTLDRAAGDPVPTRPPGEWTVAGRPAPRLDLPDKVTGRPRFIHDLVLPGMMFGRVVRPPALAAELSELPPIGLGPGEALVSDGSFVGVLAETDRAALRAARRVARAAQWKLADSPGPLPDERDLRAFLLAAPSEPEPVVEQRDPGAAASATRTLTAEFTRPFVAHASMAPSCAIARWDGRSVTVWSHSQGIFALRGAIAAGLGLAAGQVTVHHVEGAGVYGQNGADDAAMDAVLLARAAEGRPVRVQWTREDEMRWAPFGPAMLAQLSAGLDPAGRIVSWRQDVWSNGFIGRPGTSGEPRLLALTQLADGRYGGSMPAALDGAPTGAMGSTRNAVPGYDIPDLRVTRHRLLEMPIRTSSLRSLGAHLNVFAIESFMDELAATAGADPVRFRLDQLADPRARRVLAEAAQLGGWDSRVRRDGTGFGVAVA